MRVDDRGMPLDIRLMRHYKPLRNTPFAPHAPSPFILLAIAFVAAVSALVPVSAGAHAKCKPGPKPPVAAVPLGGIDLSNETVTPTASNVSVSPLDYGSTISFTVPSASSPLAYSFSVPVSSDQNLVLLPRGDAALTEALPPAPDIG